MRKWFNMAVLILGGIAFASCASHVTTTVAVGFTHQELVNKGDFTGDSNGWEAGGSIGFKFEQDGLAAIRPCIGGGLTFANQTIGDELKTVANAVPASICTEFDLSPDEDDA